MASYSSLACKTAFAATIDSCTHVAVVKNPVKGEDFDTAFINEAIITATFSNADYSITEEGDGSARVNFNGKSPGTPDLAADELSDDLVWACYDNANKLVHLVLDIVDKTVLTDGGNTVAIPAMVHHLREPSPTV